MKKIEISCMRDTFDKGFAAAKSTVGKGYDAAKSTVSKGYDAARTTVGKGYEVAKTTVEKGYDAAKTTVGKGYDAAKTTVGKGYDAAKTTVDKGIGAAKDTFDDLAAIRIKNKCECDFRITSTKKEKDLFHCGFAYDKDFQMLKVAGIVLGVAAIAATTAVVAGCIRDAVEPKKDE